MRTAQILCARPGAEYRRRIVPDVSHRRDCLEAAGLDVRPSAADLALVLQFAAKLRAERER